ncbi:TetR/AcrR family transcriptional regulator [Qipengyuania sp. XHP0211]|uniref:TetR/AcrR family transcriptional regulator n=1 Tax=Qipengyuania sp. XHP0211 TaxID=3038079 RepID=UPI00241FF1D3|nr:TetR/AcrR family transcriptional regulator [Qipengyuania sp. XHP0211]MDG5750103.1 TetR/AcrR family transcriptional regulator [Qipengyuania sp. XHP0211]
MQQLTDTADRVPRTERGRRTLRKLLDAAAAEFAESGFHEASISGITRRAGVALGTFYTYYDSKDAIFRALVGDMSEAVGAAARDAIKPDMDPLAVEQAALLAFLEFAAEHKEVYRIIDEAEFVDPDSYRAHYERIADRIEQRLTAGAATGDLRADLGEPEAWAVMGINVFLGLRYAIWAKDGDPDAATVAAAANSLLRDGLSRPDSD